MLRRGCAGHHFILARLRHSSARRLTQTLTHDVRRLWSSTKRVSFGSWDAFRTAQGRSPFQSKSIWLATRLADLVAVRFSRNPTMFNQVLESIWFSAAPMSMSPRKWRTQWTRILRACLKTQRGPVFSETARWRGARREHTRMGL